MRILFGMILGAFVTVAVAYVYDTRSGPTRTTGTGSPAVERNMVNWDVVSHNWNNVRLRMHQTWMDLSRRMAG